jgi:hypothetical protein
MSYHYFKNHSTFGRVISLFEIFSKYLVSKGLMNKFSGKELNIVNFDNVADFPRLPHIYQDQLGEYFFIPCLANPRLGHPKVPNIFFLIFIPPSSTSSSL